GMAELGSLQGIEGLGQRGHGGDHVSALAEYRRKRTAPRLRGIGEQDLVHRLPRVGFAAGAWLQEHLMHDSCPFPRPASPEPLGSAVLDWAARRIRHSGIAEANPRLCRVLTRFDLYGSRHSKAPLPSGEGLG